MGSERKRYVMPVELAMRREMAYREKLRVAGNGKRCLYCHHWPWQRRPLSSFPGYKLNCLHIIIFYIHHGCLKMVSLFTRSTLQTDLVEFCP